MKMSAALCVGVSLALVQLFSPVHCELPDSLRRYHDLSESRLLSENARTYRADIIGLAEEIEVSQNSAYAKFLNSSAATSQDHGKRTSFEVWLTTTEGRDASSVSYNKGKDLLDRVSELENMEDRDVSMESDVAALTVESVFASKRLSLGRTLLADLYQSFGENHTMTTDSAELDYSAWKVTVGRGYDLSVSIDARYSDIVDTKLEDAKQQEKSEDDPKAAERGYKDASADTDEVVGADVPRDGTFLIVAGALTLVAVAAVALLTMRKKWIERRYGSQLEIALGDDAEELEMIHAHSLTDDEEDVDIDRV